MLGEVTDDEENDNKTSSMMDKVTLEEFEECQGHEESHWVVDFDNDLVV